MPDVWRSLSALGDSRWLLPMALALLITLPRADARLKWRWLAAIAVTAGVTLASKLAFMGWGIGIKSVHFTGFSGHAAMSSAIYPVVGVLLAGPDSRARSFGLVIGVLLATAIAWSRIPLHAHSLSEVIAGLMLGLGSGAWALSTTTPCNRPSARILASALLIGLILPLCLPDLRTHQLVTALAEALEGCLETNH
ncbi:phosphatase PAP2 family protein [Stenotrophomonas maltophilia]|uniref:phosphatase PAP2 family protein n=1 Tax=Stenotrophomonas maltophilia TaxID=40324 RepID=UPI0019530DAA|nr:phosphatase PAP2 family protein [Stenotrophomonas maltophilia]